MDRVDTQIVKYWNPKEIFCFSLLQNYVKFCRLIRMFWESYLQKFEPRLRMRCTAWDVNLDRRDRRWPVTVRSPGVPTGPRRNLLHHPGPQLPLFPSLTFPRFVSDLVLSWKCRTCSDLKWKTFLWYFERPTRPLCTFTCTSSFRMNFKIKRLSIYFKEANDSCYGLSTRTKFTRIIFFSLWNMTSS